jgi:capsular exopolysaccharide synthesis family protein
MQDQPKPIRALPAALYPAEESALDLRQLLRVVRQNWRGILGLCLVTSLLTTLWVMRIPPVYRASATIMIEGEQAKTVSIEEVYGAPSHMREYFLTQFEIIKNRDIAAQVVDRLDLWNNPGFVSVRKNDEKKGFSAEIGGWLSGLFSWTSDRRAPPMNLEEQRRAAVINQFMNRLSVTPIEFTQLAVVSFESTDRQLAATVVNTLAEVYIQSQMDARLESTQAAGNWLASRLSDLKANLQASQQALQEFRDKEQILEVPDAPALSTQELNELTTRRGEARRARVSAESIYRELGGSGSHSVSQLMKMPAILQHPLVQHLAQSHTEAEQAVTNLARRYGPEHPRMMAAVAREESVRGELRQQVLQVAAGIEKEYRVALANEQELDRQLEAAKQQVAQLNRKDFRLRELQLQVETDQRLYDMFFTRAKETAETLGFQAALARVVEKATPPINPIKPRKLRIVTIAFLVSALVGIGLAILRSLLDNTLKSADDVVERLDVPLLGALPDIRGGKGQAGPYLGYLEDTRSGFAEAVRTIRTGLVLSGLEKPHKITVVTSTTPGEGKSTVAINLAAALAQMESVLLIDADLRRPAVAMALEMPSGAPGLSNVLAQSEKLEDCVHKSPHGFDVLAAGIVPANPLELLSTTHFKRLVTSLSAQYDRVVIDSAPMNAVSDSLILATLADSLVYVVKADSTPYTLALKNINVIRHSNLPLTGVVLNALDARKQAGYSGEDYSKYYGFGRG